MMSQYPSLVLETTRMSSLNKRAQQLLQQLKMKLQNHLEDEAAIQNRLNLNNNYGFDLIGNEVLNAKNWLIYKAT
jgi:hypothetical protein